MESEKRKAVPLVKEYQIRSYLASEASLEPLLPGPKPIYADIQQDWLSDQLGSEVYLPVLSQQSQAQTSASLINSTEGPYVEFPTNIGMTSQEFAAQRMNNFLSQWKNKACQETINMSVSLHEDSCSSSQLQALFECQTNMPNECPGVQGLDYNDPLVQGNKLSFQDLLAMKMPQGNISTFISDLNCQPQDEILNARSASTQQSSTNCVEEMQCHFPCRLWTYDLNSTLGTENILTNGCRQVYQPEAACPCQIIEENIVAEDKSLCTGSSSNQQNEKAEGQVAVSRVYELENPVAESSSVMIENHNPDKGFNNIDLNETPQRKSRRRKHRPKVVSEDKPKRTSKLKVSQPTNSEGMPKPKRKYIRKNETHPPSTPPSAVIYSTEVVDPKESVCAFKSCRRGLNFGVDDHEKIEGLQSNKTNSAGLEPVSGIHSRNEDKLTAGSVDNLSHKVNQMQRNCIAVPEFEKPKRTPKPKVSQPKNSTGMPRRKRKCVQKNEINLSPTPSSAANFSAEAVDPKESVCAVKSCRRGLNFEEDGNEKIKGSQKNKTNAAGLESFSAIYHAHEDRLTAGSADNVSQRANQMLKNCITVPEFGKVSCVSQEQLKADAVYESQVNGNCQAAAASSIKGDMTSPQASSPNSSVCASSKEGLSMKESKGAYSNVHDEVHMKAKNLNSTTHGTFYQSSPLHLQKRTEKVQKPITETSSTTVSEATRKKNSAHDHERGNPGTTKYYQYCIPPLLTTCSITNRQADAVGVTGKRPKSRISEGNCDKAEAQICDLISWTGYAAGKRPQTQLTIQKRKYSSREKFNHLNRSPSFMEALAAECSTTQTENKRPRKKYSTLNLNESSICDTNMQRSLVPYDDPQSVRNYRGPYLALPWKHSHPIDGITDTLEQLDIHRERSQTQRESAIALHCTNNQAQNALVHYKKDDTMVPFEGDPIRKRHQRARVYLDEETNRVWRLLLENINNEGIDGTDEEKAKWWANERRVFCGRVDSFIARMRLVQGDRRFTPWKGSVVDSVVGVFLTQNVSDHLSSSAFMSVAARFPLKSQGEIRIDSEGNSILVEEPMEPDNAVTWIGQTMDEPVCDRTSWTFHDIDHGEEKEVENSKEPLSAVSLNDHSCRNTCSTENSQKMHHEMITFGANRNHEEKRTSTSEDAKAIDEIALLQHSVVPSHNLADSPTAPTAGRFSSCSDSNSEQEDLTTSSRTNLLYPPSSFVELLKMAETSMLPEAFLRNAPTYLTANQIQSDKKEHKWKAKQNADCIQMLDREIILSDNLSRKDQSYSTKQSDLTTESMIQFPFYNRTPDSNQKPSCSAENTCSSYVFERQKMIIESQRQSTKQDYPDLPSSSKNDCVTENISVSDEKKKNMHTFSQPFLEKSHDSAETPITQNQKATKHTRGSSGKDGKTAFDWDGLRKQAQAAGGIRERTANTRDSLDWEAVRRADVSEIAETIKDRGMNNKLAERIKDFLDRLVREHGSIDLEWLRDVPPDRAKEYLLSIRGLGLKSVECVRLLTLHHLAFPVDTNVGRIAVRLGWVPLQPLPESLQLHLLELYPVLESIQKYLWPRLCKLDQRTLYELHYHMITFGKVFCTKRQPNCNACPLRGECRHFASAFASARLGLPGPEERRIMTSTQGTLARNDPQPQVTINPLPLPATQENPQSEVGLEVRNCEPIIEVPASPEPEQVHDSEYDIEDAFFEDSDIPTIKLNMDQFTQTLQNLMQGNMELQQVDMSKALVALTAEAASIPTPKLKNVSRLRTEHHVYELPDNHPLLKGLDKREPDDPCSYLLAIWTPGETANSIQPPEKRCTSEGLGELCEDLTCFYCNSQRETSSQIVRGTLLIPCRTAMRGSFPLNGTYFQVNEVFADHDSSLSPLSVPRGLIWHLPRKTVYFGTSVPTIFRGLSTEGIQHCFWKGYVCVRGFDQQSRAPRPLMARLHFPRSKMTKTGAKASQRDE